MILGIMFVLLNIFKIYVYLWSLCNLLMYLESLFLLFDGFFEGEGWLFVVFVESIKFLLNDWFLFLGDLLGGRSKFFEYIDKLYEFCK